MRAHTLIISRTFGGQCADVAIDQPERGLFGLIDGEVEWDLPTYLSAQCACAAIRGALDGWSPQLAGSPESASLLGDALRRANDAIAGAAADDPRFRGLGASAALLGVGPNGWTTAHVGDVRIYGLRAPTEVSLLTEDHSLFNDLVRRGDLREQDFEGFAHNAVITQALGMQSPVDVRTRTATRSPGERFVLCTQGLWRTLGPAATLELLSAHASDPDALFDAFRAALASRHHPDASVIVVTL